MACLLLESYFEEAGGNFEEAKRPFHWSQRVYSRCWNHNHWRPRPYWDPQGRWWERRGQKRGWKRVFSPWCPAGSPPCQCCCSRICHGPCGGSENQSKSQSLCSSQIFFRLASSNCHQQKSLLWKDKSAWKWRNNFYPYKTRQDFSGLESDRVEGYFLFLLEEDPWHQSQFPAKRLRLMAMAEFGCWRITFYQFGETFQSRLCEVQYFECSKEQFGI